MEKKKRIHLPYNKLKGALRERNLTYGDIAKTLNISETSVAHKINGISDFYIGQVNLLQEVYGIERNVFLTSTSCEFNNKNEAG